MGGAITITVVTHLIYNHLLSVVYARMDFILIVAFASNAITFLAKNRLLLLCFSGGESIWIVCESAKSATCTAAASIGFLGWKT